MTSTATAPQAQAQPKAHPDPAVAVLLAEIVAATAAVDLAEAHKRGLLDQLSVLHDLGRVDDKLATHSGWALQWSAGRQTYDYPDDVIELEAQLQAAREAAVAARRATPKPAKPFWIVRKPRKAQEAEA
jgi:hypothetical protein